MQMKQMLLLLLIVLLMLGIAAFSSTGSRAAAAVDLHQTIQQSISTNIFELESTGRDGNGQRTIG
jgi:outer membrane lipoprotein-sorting protein